MWRRRHFVDAAALEVDEDSTFVFLGAVLQAQFAAYLLNSWFDLLYVVLAVVALADDDVEVGLALLSGDSDSFLEHVFCFFYEETVQVNCVAVNAPLGIVFPEDEVACLAVVLLHLFGVLLSFL